MRRGKCSMRYLLVLLCLLTCCASAQGAKAPRPDILLLMPDQFRGDSLSAVKHPVVKTPALDDLAARGVLFRRAYSTVPSCIPARFALLTGLAPQKSGVVGYKAKKITTPTLPALLARVGYATVLVGRNMHQLPESGPCGYQRQIPGSTYIAGDDYDTFLQKSAPETSGIRELVKTLGLSNNHWPATPWPLDERLHPTEWIAAQTRRVIRETTPTQPLFLTSSYYAPHPPLFPPKKHFDSVGGRKLPQPARGEWVDWQSLSPAGDGPGHRVLLEGKTLRDAQAGYYGLIEHLDEQFAPIIRDFCQRSEKAGRPWVIAVTSDHGEMLGDHGYFRKCEPYEGSANIPFIVCASPELGFRAGHRVGRPVCLEDLLPTLVALAGGKCPRQVSGVNLLPALRGEKQLVREWLHFEHAPCYGQEQSFQALTDGRLKYIWRPADGSEQLFDLERDPREERDLSKDAASSATLALWRSRLAGRLAERPEGFVENGKLVAGRKYRPLNKGTLAGGRKK